MVEQKRDYNKEVVSLLKRKPYGLTIIELSDNLRINRLTAAKYLAVLAATNQITVRELGKAKLHYPKGVKIK